MSEDVDVRFSYDFLRDAFNALLTDVSSLSNPNAYVFQFTSKYKSAITASPLIDFDVIKTFASGSVGMVSLVKRKRDSQYFALKILRKHTLLSRREASFFMEEKEAMIRGRGSKWITKLYSSFQDPENLYLLMEFVQGGSLGGYLNGLERPMDEKDARFYAAEMVLAVKSVHDLGFLHRDIKPDNFLIDKSGHLKLADFGSCIKIDQAKTMKMHESVGTPDYISPEILRAHEGETLIDVTCDFWSLGICIYEIVFDEVPFYAETLVQTYGRIMEHEKYFELPDSRNDLSGDLIDLIKKLICSREKRLGRNGIHELTNHPWFSGIKWDSLHQETPSFKPVLSGPEDVHYFEDEQVEFHQPSKSTKVKEFSGASLPFIGYTFMDDSGEDLQKGEEEHSQAKGQIDDLERKNISLLAENTKMRLDIEIEAHEKERLELKLQSVTKENAVLMEKQEKLDTFKSNFDNVVAENAMLKSSVENHSKQITTLLTEIEANKLQLAEIELLKIQLASERQNQERIAKTFANLESDLVLEREKALEYQNSLNMSMKRTEGLELQIRDINNEVVQKDDELKLLNQSNDQLSIQHDALNEQLSKLKCQFLAAQSEISILKERISQFTPSAEKNEDIIRNLEEKVTELTSFKCQAVSSIDLLNNQNNALKMEVQKFIAKLQEETKKNEILSEDINRKETQVLELKNQMGDLEEQKSLLNKQLTFANNKINSLKDCLHKENELVKDYQVKTISRNDSFLQLQDENYSINSSLADTRGKLEKLVEEFRSLESQLSEEKSISQKKDVVISEQSLLVQSLQNETHSQRERIGIIKTQYDNFVSESHTLILTAKKEYSELERLYAEEREKRLNLETIKAKMSTFVMELEFAAKKDSAERQELDQLLDNAKNRIEELEAKVADRSHFSSDITLNASGQYTPHKIPRKSRLSFKNLFRNSGNLIHSVASITSRESLESHNAHSRCRSIDTCGKSQHSLFEPFDENLKGYLKVPKGGKLRKGWIERFFTVREYKLFMYDKEQDMDHSEGTFIADFSGYIFSAKAVAQNEVIHVNPRDSHLIFKVQASADKTISDVSDLTETIIYEKNFAAIKNKLLKLSSNLELEIKMRNATEKILHASTESQRPVVMGQLEAISKRIQNLESDIKAYERAAKFAPDTGDEDPIDIATRDSVRALKSELERQIQEKKDLLEGLCIKISLKKGAKYTEETEDKVQALKRSIIKLKDTILDLDSNNIPNINRILSKYEYNLTHLDHQFSVKQFSSILDCSVCHEALWGNKNQGLECSVCKEICHRNCMSLIDISCRDVQALRRVPTLYFMASDTKERSRWLFSLAHLRRQLENNM